ncbi:hypothetical protein CAEBREN_18258 [Caenorhabditis brenneri]|uniref:ATP-dependent DNA helicase n=1 Tax=Caenorhabditis brenneri TaxID=135651 RepID=G0NX04_CAEBE|nr:hypothetical protein CAEBREN_18258 [Caenorhabditis brenneri]
MEINTNGECPTIFLAFQSLQIDSRDDIRLLKNYKIEFKLIINHDVARGLFNGSVEKVEEISKDKIIVQFPRSRMEVSRVLYEKEKKMWRQFPLRMAEAMTIHAAQGKTYDDVIVLALFLDIGGLMYTALSRARLLKLCRITSLKLEQWIPPTGAKEEPTSSRYARMKRKQFVPKISIGDRHWLALKMRRVKTMLLDVYEKEDMIN